MPSIHSVNGVNSSHDQWSMRNASFESHGTSTRDLLMTRASFHTEGMFNRWTCLIPQFVIVTLKLHLQVAVLASIQEARVNLCILYLRCLQGRSPTRLYITIFGYVNKKIVWYWFVILQCVYRRLRNLKEIHGSYKTLISSKKAMHGFLGTYSIGSTKNVRFINRSYNETAAAQVPWHAYRVSSGKECSWAISKR